MGLLTGISEALEVGSVVVVVVVVVATRSQDGHMVRVVAGNCM